MYLGGYVSDNVKIFNLKKKFRFFMIEDACHALGSNYLHKEKNIKLAVVNIQICQFFLYIH